MDGGNQADVDESSSQGSPNQMENEPAELPEVNQVPPADSSDEQQSKESPDATTPETSPPDEDVDKQDGEGVSAEDAEKEPDKDQASEKAENEANETKKEPQSSTVTENNTPKEPESKQIPAVISSNGGGGGGGDQTSGLDRNTPFQPWYKTIITDAIKDGENITFTVETTRLDETSKHFTVERIYEDFEWLHHCLTTENDIGGIVIPPLPLKPVSTAADTAAKSRRELGEDSKTLKGDEFEKHMRRLEKYLITVIRHSVFGRDMVLARFLTETNAPARAKLRKSILNNLSKAVEGVIKGNHQDVDEWFQKYRLSAANMVPLSKEMNTNFQGMINHSERLSGALNHFSTALCLVSSADSSKTTAQMNEMQLTFARSMEHLSHAVSVFTTNDERTLGFTLDLYSKYAESVKQMLGRRTVKLYEFNSAVKSYEKAKPLKKQAAEETKDQREKEFNDITETARQELDQYKKQRILDFQQALVLYAEAKIKTARDAYALLAKDLSSIKTMELDGS